MVGLMNGVIEYGICHIFSKAMTGIQACLLQHLNLHAKRTIQSFDRFMVLIYTVHYRQISKHNFVLHLSVQRLFHVR